MTEHDPTEGDASFETDRHTDDQPPREDLIPLEELEDLADEDLFGEEESSVSEDEEILPRPTSEDLPESQGEDVDLGDKISEDYADRPPLSDEER